MFYARVWIGNRFSMTYEIAEIFEIASIITHIYAWPDLFLLYPSPLEQIFIIRVESFSFESVSLTPGKLVSK